MNTKQIILTSALLGFTLPSVAAIGSLVVTSKMQDTASAYFSDRETLKANTHMAGCGCPFCQKFDQKVEKSS